MMKALKERYMKKYLVGVEGIFALQTLSYFLFYCSLAEGPVEKKNFKRKKQKISKYLSRKTLRLENKF